MDSRFETHTDNLLAQGSVHKGGHQSLKLLGGRVPGHGTGSKTLVVSFFFHQLSAITKSQRDAAWHFIGKSSAVVFGGLDKNSSQKGLNILALDAIWLVLFGHHPAIQQGDSHQVRQAVIRFLFGPDKSFIPSSPPPMM